MVEHQPSKLNTWVRFPSPAFFYALKILGFKAFFICSVPGSYGFETIQTPFASDLL